MSTKTTKSATKTASTPAKRRAPVTPDEMNIAKMSSLSTSIDVLSANKGGKATVTLEKDDGTKELLEVSFHSAKMKHLGQMVGVIGAVVNSLKPEDFHGLLEMIATKQQNAIDQGMSPHNVSFSQEDVMGIMIGGHATFLTALHSIATQLGEVVEMFTSLTSEQYGDLGMEDGILVLVAIVGCNYSFFTQTLPQALGGIFQSKMLATGKV